MSANVTAVTFTNVTAGAKFSIAWTQAASGGPYTVTYGGSTSNTCQISPTASIVTTQEFEVGNDGSTVKGTGCTSTESGVIRLPGSSSGTMTIVTPSAASGVNTLQAVTDTFVYRATTDTLTNKTVDGVTPTVFGYLDPTSSVQTQLNAKQSTLTGTGIARNTGASTELSGDCATTGSNAVTCTGGTHLTGVPTSAMAVPQGNGTKVQLSTGSTTTNDCVKFDANGNTIDAGSACGSGGGGPTSNQNIRQPSVFFDGGGSALSGSLTRCAHYDYGGTINKVTIISDVSGSATIDVRTVADGSYTGPASTSTITASDIPALSSAVHYSDSTLTGWTTALAANSDVCYYLTSPSTLTWVQLVLDISAN